MDLGLENKVVIVTGGAKGIGAGIVRALAQEGALPVIVDRNPGQAALLQHDLRQTGRESDVIGFDVSSPENCEEVIRRTLQTRTRIDGLVNNAGKNDGVGLEIGSPEKFRKSLQENLSHYYDLAHFALPALKKTCGSIVNIGSKVSVTGQGKTSGYAASKGGIMALTREWAVELLPYSIRVNAVIPAEVMTPLYRRWLDTFPNPNEKLASIVSKIPLEKRMTTSEEIAAMVLFLLSSNASHITGQHLFVDGGYTHLDRALT